MSRIRKLQNRLDRLYIDAFLVTNGKNIEYLTGFPLPSGDGALLITKDNAIMITDGRYQVALTEFQNDEVAGLLTGDYYGSLNQICQGMHISVLGFEDSISYQLYDVLDDLMAADLVPFHNVIEQMRAIKSSDEVEKLRTAAQLLSHGYDYVLGFVHAGMTEKSVANRLDYWMKEHGTSQASFPTIVASGANAAKPHATASDKMIQDGDIVILDFGYFVDGYTADMTRTFAIGSIDPELKDVYQIVNEARLKVISQIRSGIHGDKLDSFGRALIQEAGYDDEFNHGMGHGIGLAVHELPLTYGPATSDVQLQTNNVITVEPGIYIPKLGGVRIEDDVVVSHGDPDVLTTASTDLTIIK